MPNDLVFLPVDSPPSVDYSVAPADVEGVGNLDSDPLFVDVDLLDFRLQAGSPCIDAADGDAAPASDIGGNPRVDVPETPNTGTGDPDYADIGAHEHQP
jgi:hypothetical protein